MLLIFLQEKCFSWFASNALFLPYNNRNFVFLIIIYDQEISENFINGLQNL